MQKKSMNGFRKVLEKAVQDYSYTEISNETGIARSTLYRILSGEIENTTLSTVEKIELAIKKLKKVKKSA